MNDTIEIYAVVEGQTEQTFIRDVLAPVLGARRIFITPTILGVPGHKGGNVRFSRVATDIVRFLKQRNNTYVTTMFDLYGLDPEWPGRNKIPAQASAIEKAAIINAATAEAIRLQAEAFQPELRFLPNIMIHEFEAILFSDPATLARNVGVGLEEIHDILAKCQEPEEINDGPTTAPSKRLQTLNRGYRKIVMGKTISESIGIPTIRERCPVFNRWVEGLEKLSPL